MSLFMLGAAAFMVALDSRVIDPLLRTMMVDFNVPYDRMALAVSAYTFPYSLGQLIYGPLGDRIGKVRVMAIGFTFFACGTAACAFVPHSMAGFWLLIAFRFFTGMFAAAIIPLSIAYIGDKFSPDKRQAMLGQFMSALMLGAVMSGPIGGVCGEYLGWRNVFLVLGTLSMIVMVAYWRSARTEHAPVRDPNKPRTPAIEAYLTVLANPNSRIVYPAIFLEGLFLFGGFVPLASSLQMRFELSLLQAGLLVSFYGLGGLCYSFLAKRVTRALQQWQMAALGGTLLLCGFTVVALLVKLHAWWPVIPGAWMIGFGFNSLHSTLQTKATELSVKLRGTAVSLFAFFFFLGQTLGVPGGAHLSANFGAFGGADGKLFIPAFWITFATAGMGLFLMSSWLATRLPKMAKEELISITPAEPIPNAPAALVD